MNPRVRASMHLLGFMTGLEFFANAMFVFASSHIMGGIGGSPRELALVQTSYAAGALLMLVQQQWLSQRFGYRNYLAAAAMLFACGTTGCALSGNSQDLAVARFVQGFGGAAFFTSGRILVNHLFAPALRLQAVKRFMGWALGLVAVGPVAAAYLVDGAGWSAVFWSLLPPTALVLVGVLWLLPGPAAAGPSGLGRWPWLPLLAFGIAAFALQTLLSTARLDALSRPEWMATLGLAVVVILGGFFRHQWRHPTPLIKLRALTHPGFLFGLLLYAAYYVLSNFTGYLFPVYAQQGLGIPLQATGWLNTGSGLATMALGLAYMRFAGRIRDKRHVMVAGTLALAFSAWSFAHMPAGAPELALWPGLLAKGAFALMMIFPIAMSTFTMLAPAHFGHGYASKNIVRQVASSLATAAAAVLLQERQLSARSDLVVHVSPHRPEVTQWIHGVESALNARGFSPAQAHDGAMELLSRAVDQQALLNAADQIYLWVGAGALVMGLLLALQRRIR